MAEHAFRYDAFTVRGKPEKTPEGYLRVPAYLARTGILEYRFPDGKVRRELRRPEEVFSEDSLKSWDGLPVTLEHPNEPVTSENFKRYIVGTVHNVRREDVFVAGDLVIMDPEAVKAVENKSKRELSGGYRQLPIEMPGQWNGMDFDAEQTQIRGNHVALVRVGRAGPEVRVRMDSADAVQVDGDPAVVDKPKEASVAEKATRKVRLRADAVEVEMPEEAAAAVTAMQSEMDEMGKQYRDMEGKMMEEKSRADKAQARADSAEAALKQERESVPSRIDAEVKRRLAIIERARPVLGNELRADAAPEEIQTAAVCKVSAIKPADLSGKSADYLNARFDAAMEMWQMRNPAADPPKPADAPKSEQRKDSAGSDAMSDHHKKYMDAMYRRRDFAHGETHYNGGRN